MNDLIRSKGAKYSLFIVGMIGITAIMFVIFSNSNITAESRAPKVVFTENSHDFGKVPQGPEMIYNFKFRNNGNAPLKIEKITSSCGCTGATSGGKDVFDKGESGEITVSFKTQGREGRQDKSVLVFTNDPASPQVMLRVMCTIDSNMK